MINAKKKYAFILQILLAQPCIADNWSINDKQEFAPEKSEDRVIKWCDNKTGKNIRYSSANIEIKDYHPCGAIVSSETCDAENNKILGNQKSGIFKICEKNSSNKDSFSPGLSRSEIKELKVAMRKAADKHNSDPEIQLQMLADKLLSNFSGGNKDLANLINTKDPQKLMGNIVSILEKNLPLLDSNTRKLLQPLLKNLKKGK